MRIERLEIPGCAIATADEHLDERGTFVRAFDADAFAAAGLDGAVAHANLSTNVHRGTLRGLHYQTGEHAEAKTIRVLRGAVFDVVVDLRPDSETYCRWIGIELRDDEPRSLSVPAGVAHGYLTLRDDTQLLYLMSRPYEPTAAAGVRWDDQAFGIEWPFAPALISDRDRALPDYVV